MLLVNAGHGSVYLCGVANAVTAREVIRERRIA